MCPLLIFQFPFSSLIDHLQDPIFYPIPSYIQDLHVSHSMDEQRSFDKLCELTFTARIPSHSDQKTRATVGQAEHNSIRSQPSIKSPQTIFTEQYPPPSPVIPRSRRQDVATFQEQRTVWVMEEKV